jgi:hypothetical protein
VSGLVSEDASGDEKARERHIIGIRRKPDEKEKLRTFLDGADDLPETTRAG